MAQILDMADPVHALQREIADLDAPSCAARMKVWSTILPDENGRTPGSAYWTPCAKHGAKVGAPCERSAAEIERLSVARAELARAREENLRIGPRSRS